MKSKLIILVKFATRGRKQRFKDGLLNIYNLCANPENIRVVITADENDPEMNNDEVKEFVKEFDNCVIMYGVSENKIHACNRDLNNLPEGYKEWDILANFSDDQRWDIYGWDELIRTDFERISPDLSHYMAYLDPDTHGALSTLFIAGRGWVDRFNFIYDPQFASLFCDNLAEDCAKHLGKYHYTGYTIYHHYNPSYNYKDFKPDEMYKEQQAVGWDIDQKLYHKIKEEGLVNYLKSFE